MEINQPAAGLSLPDMEGGMHHLHDLRGRVVIVNFWSAECPLVERVDHDLLLRLKDWGERVRLVTVAINVNECDALVRGVGQERGLPLVLRGNPQVQVAWGAQTTPHFFVLDPAGVLRYRGAYDDVTFRKRTPTRCHLGVAVDALLAGSLPEVAEIPPYGCAIVGFVLE